MPVSLNVVNKHFAFLSVLGPFKLTRYGSTNNRGVLVFLSDRNVKEERKKKRQADRQTGR